MPCPDSHRYSSLELSRASRRCHPRLMCAVLAQAAQALITHSLNGEFGRYAAHAVICFLDPRTWSVHCACAQNQCPHAFLLLRSLTMSPCVASAGHPCAGSGTHVREHVVWRLLALGTTGGIGIDARTPLMRSVGAALAVEVAAACATCRALIWDVSCSTAALEAVLASLPCLVGSCNVLYGQSTLCTACTMPLAARSAASLGLAHRNCSLAISGACFRLQNCVLNVDALQLPLCSL